MTLNLVIVYKLLSFLEHQGADMWTLRQTLSMLAFTGVLSVFSLIVLRFLGYFITGNSFYIEYGYNSLNVLVMCVVMCLKQRFPEREYDTQIPFITGNFKIAF